MSPNGTFKGGRLYCPRTGLICAEPARACYATGCALHNDEVSEAAAKRMHKQWAREDRLFWFRVMALIALSCAIILVLMIVGAPHLWAM